MPVELTSYDFEARYAVGQLAGRPPGIVREFRHPRRAVGASELVLETETQRLWFEVVPWDGEPWVGGFECGPGGLTGLFATPSPSVLCVVAKGQGFWVPVLTPGDHEIVRSIPIQAVFEVAGQQKLVFADHTRLAAYGPEGLLWLTEDLSWDGLKVTEVSASLIRGIAWDAPGNREIPFSVDAATGATDGGSSPVKYGTGLGDN